MSFSPRTHKIIELREKVIQYDNRIRQLGVEIVEELGCSTQGCAYLTSDGRAAKITTDWDEIRLGQWLYIAQKEGKNHPSLPKIYLVRMLEPGLFLIVREELSDVEFEHPYWFDDEIAEGAYHLFSGLIAEVERGTSYGDAFEGYALAISMLFSSIIDKANNAEYEDVWADDIDKAEEIWKSVRWLLDHNILICDIISDNWGVRKDGTIVIRDLGCNNAPILDPSLYLPYRPNPDENTRDLERAYKADPKNEDVKNKYISALIRQGDPIGSIFRDDDIQSVHDALAELPFLIVVDTGIESIPFAESPGIYVAGLHQYAHAAIRMKYKLKTRSVVWKGKHFPSPGHKKSYSIDFTINIVYLDGSRPLVNINIEPHWAHTKRIGYRKMEKILRDRLNKLFDNYQKTPFTQLDKVLSISFDFTGGWSLSANEESLLRGKIYGLTDKEIIEQTSYNWPRLKRRSRRSRRYKGREDALVSKVLFEILRQSPRIFDQPWTLPDTD